MRIPSGLLVGLCLTVALTGCAEQSSDGAEQPGAPPESSRPPASDSAAPPSPDGRSESGPDSQNWDSTAVSAPPIDDAQASEIQLASAVGVWRLVLPAEASAALRARVPSFMAWTALHYWRAIVEYGFFEFNQSQAMFAVVGDFNGDGVSDAVVDGRAGSDALRMLLVSTEDGYTLSELARRPLTPGEATFTEAIEFLSLASPGEYSEPAYLGARSVNLAADGFVVTYFEKGATLHYLRDGRWQELTLSD